VRAAIALLAALVLGTVAGTSVVWSRSHRPVTPVTAGAGPVRLDAGGLLLVRDRHLALTDLHHPAARTVRVSPVECVRAYAAAGTGACLHQDTPWTYSLRILDAGLRRRRSFAVPGLPNRLQVSRSGRMVSWTSFVSGDSYAGSTFSTRTGILDTTTGTRIDSLESFTVERGAKPYRRSDLNFWGVTFGPDDRHFFATMATAGHRYLVAGDVVTHRVRVVEFAAGVPPRTSSAPRRRRTAPDWPSSGRSVPTRPAAGGSRCWTWAPAG
jgi:hypothetical protein